MTSTRPRLRPRPLRALTYLAPGLPLELFQAVVDHVGRAIGRPIELVSESRHSGPMHGDHDPFAAGEAEIGFVCSPSYLYLTSGDAPTVELVPAGFVFDDSRNAGAPHYFSDVVVRADRGERGLDDLRGSVLGFNDTCSMSGYYAALQAVDEGFFGAEICTGSHAASIEALLGGDVDVACIDSNVLALERAARPALGRDLRVVESLGPHPIQPVVVRRDLADELAPAVADALLGLAGDRDARDRTRAFGLRSFAPISAELYAEERRVFERLGFLSARCG
ncbi:MAG: PhnD/SsuA/transferrin family substrate-binding protein [Planctomycetota bacterium]